MSSPDWRIAFGRRLAAARTAAGISQADLAQRIGADKGTVYRWESGRLLPDAGRLARICAALEISADVLLG